MDVSYFWNGVNIALSKRDLSESWLCKETGLSLRTMKNRIKKGIQPRLDEAVRITDALGMSLDSICDGSETASESPVVSKKLRDVPRSKTKEYFDGDFKVPVYEQLFSAGHGQFLADEEEVSGYIAAPNNLKRYSGHLAATFVRGDSMEPTLFSGDTIICDNLGYDGTDGIYIIHYKGMGFVKRLKKMKDGISIISDNPIYEPMFEPGMSEDFRVVGKVRYCMGGHS